MSCIRKCKKISILLMIAILLLQIVSLNSFAEPSQEMELIGRDYIKSPTEWKGNKSNDGILQTNIYPESSPMVKRVGNVTVLAWISDNRARNSANRTELVYSVQTSIDGAWSEPKPVDNDNTADFYPYLYDDGESIYIAWQNLKKTFLDNEVTIEKVSAASEIKVAKFDMNSKVFGNPVPLTDNDTLDKLPIIAGDKNKAYTVWCNNNANDLFDVKGTNSLYYSYMNGDVWSESISLIDNVGKVISMSCEVYMDKLYIVYSKDTDDKLETVTDREIFCTIVTNGAVSKTIKMTNNSIIDSMPTLIKRNNELMLIWYADKNIMFTKNFDNPSAELFLPDQIDGFNDNFKVVFDESNISLLWAKATYDKTEGYAALYDEVTKEMSNVVKITKTNDNYVSFDGIYNSKSELMLFSNVQRIIQKNENGNIFNLYGLNDLCVDKVVYEANGAIQRDTVFWDEYDFVPGEEMPIEFDFKNIGTLTISKIKVELYDGDPKAGGKILGSTEVNEHLRAGCTKRINIGFKPNEAKLYNLFINVKVDNDIDVDKSDNVFSFKTGYSDVSFKSLLITGTGNIRQIQAVIENNSNVPAKEVKCIIYGDADGKKIISETYFDSIERYNDTSIMKQIDIKNLDFGEHVYKEIYLVLESKSEDYVIGNNVRTIMILKPEVAIPFELNILSAGLNKSKNLIDIDLSVGNKEIDGIIKGKLEISLYEKATNKLVKKIDKLVEVKRYTNLNVRETITNEGTFNGEYYVVADISRVQNDNIPKSITKICVPQAKWVGVFTDTLTIKYPDSQLNIPPSILPSTHPPVVTPTPVPTPDETTGDNTTGGNATEVEVPEEKIPGAIITPTQTPPAVTPTPASKDEDKALGIDAFSDINNHWAKEYIKKLFNEKVVSGYPDNTIRPDISITREEAITIIVKALGYEPVANPDLKFKDTASIGDWAKGYIAIGVEKGIIKGFDDNTFRGSKKCSRSEFVTMLLRAMDLSGENTNVLTFDDTEDIPQWAFTYIEKAVSMGIIKGYPDNTVKPIKDVTRAEAFTMLAKSVYEME